MMIGLLSPEEIESMLRHHHAGRLGCSVGNRPYVVPTNYVYDGTHIFSCATIGRKIEMMRQQPVVCFEVDEVSGPANWRSVIAEGVYEELVAEDERQAVLDLLNGWSPGIVPRTLDASGQLVVFRLRLTAKSGRFERRDA
jgi:nitroimidazol reductase NimA-like FMN-containing flavoprotein (pyridoxamine 5'-phosphate oxidase superfamily)